MYNKSKKSIEKMQNFTKETGLPVSKIRYWVKVGKLKPTMYTESGYMMFSQEQINKVKRLNQK